MAQALVSDTLTYADAMAALHGVSGRLGREINPIIYSVDEWRSRVDSGNSFVTRVLARPRIDLMGSAGGPGA